MGKKWVLGNEDHPKQHLCTLDYQKSPEQWNTNSNIS